VSDTLPPQPPDPRAQSPDPLADPPDPRAQPPDPRAQSPDPLADPHRRHLYEGEPDEDLVSFLEPDQLVEQTHLAFPRRRLSPWAQRGLALLRVFVLLLAALVLYVFAREAFGL
jgi:hypothetical protein